MVRSIVRFTVLAAALAVAGASPLLAASFSSSQSGNWSVATTWGGAGVPGAGDSATINSGHTVTVDVPVSVSALTITGNLNGTQNITVTSTLNWNGGTQSGGGTTIVPATATATLTNYSILDGRTLNVAGAFNLTSNFYFYMQNNAALTNSGTIDYQGDNGIYLSGAVGTMSITNSGTIKKSGGTGLSYVGIPLVAQNGSQFLVQSNGGTFNVAAVTSTGGTFNASNGATLNFNTSDTRSFDAASTIGGAGTVQFTGTNTINGTYNVTGATKALSGTTTINSITSTGDVTAQGGTLTLNSASTLSIANVLMTGGTLAGTAPITLTGTSMSWTGGTLAGSGQFTIPNTTTITFNGAVSYDARPISNAGTLNYASNNYSYFSNGAAFTNSGTVDFQGDGGFYISTAGGSVTNSGIIKKSGGTAQSYVQIPLTMQSSSQFLVQSGTFNVAAVTSTSAAFNVSTGATLTFNTSDTRTFDAASSITATGTGTVQFASGTNTVNAAYNVAGATKNSGTTTIGTNNITAVGDVTVTGGTLTLNNSTAPTIGNIAAQGGTLTLNIPTTLSIPILAMSGGTLNGTAGISLTGTSMTWTGGTLAGSGLLTIPASTTITFNGVVNYDTRPISNAGTLNYTSSNYSYFINGAALTNTGTVDFQGDGGFYISTGGGSVINGGIIKKSAGASFGYIQTSLLAQSGSQLLAQSGTFNLAAVTSTGAAFNVSTGATLTFNTNDTRTFDAASSITAAGTGTVQFASGTNTVGAAYNVTGTTKSTGGTTTIGNITSVGDLFVSGGTLTLNSAATLSVGTLTMQGGTLNGTAPISLTNAAMTWIGGTIAGSGLLTIPNTTTITFNGAVYYDTRPISNAGTLNYTSSNYSYFLNGAVLTNSGTVDFQGDGGFYASTGSGSVINSGTIKKSASSGTAQITIPLTAQSGSQVLAQSGTLFVAGVTSTGATFSASTGATLNFNTNDARSFDAASTISGAGTMQFGSGTNTVNATFNVTGITKSTGGATTIGNITAVGDLFVSGGTLTLNSATALSVGTLTMQGGTLNGTAPINLTGPASTWSGGVIGGGGTLSIPVGTTIAIAGGPQLDARPVNNAGTINFTSTNYMYLQNNAVLTNSGTIDFQGDSNLYLNGPAGTTAVINSGTIKKSAGSTSGSSFSVSLTLQTGSQLLVQAGTLYLGNITSTSATLNVSSGATAWFYYTATANFDAASSITGAGTVQLNAGTNTINGNYNITGATKNGGATTTIGTSITSVGSLTVSAGTLTLNSAGALSVPTLTMQGGTLNGTAPINITGSAMTWSGGVIGGGGTLDIPVSTTITIGGGVTFDTRPFTNAGTINFTGGNYVYMQNNAVLTNSGTIDLQGDGSVYLNGPAGTTAVINSGTIKKSAGTSGSSFSVPLTLQGGSQLLVQAKILYLGNVTSTGATLNISSGATALFYYTSIGTFDAASTITGAGTLQCQAGTNTVGGSVTTSILVNGGTLTLNSASTLSIPTLTMQGGTLNGTANINLTSTAMTWSGGTIGGGGTLSIPPATTITIGGVPTLDARQVTNGGIINVSGGNYFYMQNSALLTNNGTIDFQGDGGVYQNTGTASVVNTGTIKKSAGTSGSTLTVPLTMQSGSQFLIQSGLFYLGNVTSTGATLNIASGATALFYYTSTSSFDAASSITGAGTLQCQAGTNTVSGNVTASILVNGGTLTLNSASPLTIPTLTMQGGTLNGTANINLSSAAMTWSGGTIGGGGTLSIPPGTVITINGVPFIDARQVTNAGTINFNTTNYLYLQNNAVLTNSGTIDFQGDSSMYLNSGTASVINTGTGTIKKSAGASGSAFNVPLTMQSGSQFLIQSSIVYLGNITSTGGTFSISSGKTMWLYYTTTATFDAASSITGAGTLEVQAGTTTFSGTLSTAVIMVGGTLTVNSAGTQSIPTLTMQGGTFNGTGNVSLTGTASTWTGGVLGGSGTLTIPTGTTITINGSAPYLDGRAVNNAGTLRFVAGNYMYMQNGATITNGGTIDFQGDGAIYVAAGLTSVTNNGMIMKSAGTSTAAINPPVTNNASGTVKNSTGVLAFNPLIQNGGTISILIASATSFGVVQDSNGTFGFNGTLSATTTGGYTPPNGTTFQVLTFPSHSGSFTTKFLNYVGGTFTDSTTATALTLTAGPSSCFSSPGNIVSQYKGEGNANDSSGPNNATASGGVTFVTGKVGQAFNFDGTTGYASAPDDPSLRVNTFTLEGWVNFSATPSGINDIANKALNSSLFNSFALCVEGGLLKGAVGDSGGFGSIATATFTPTTGTWHHVAFTFDSSSQVQQLYVDGAPAGASVVSGKLPGYDSGPFMIGSDFDNNVADNFFPGQIDELTLYSRVLSSAEILAIYNADSNGKCYVPPSAPTVGSVIPAMGNVTGGTSVAVTGTNLDSVSSITFGGSAATVTARSAGSLTVTTPPHAAGAVTVNATNPGGSGSGTYTYVAAPTVTGFSPPFGPPGTSVTVFGASFTTTTAVAFNGVAASFTVNNDGQITATVPLAATTGPVSVTNIIGTAASASSFTVSSASKLAILSINGGINPQRSNPFAVTVQSQDASSVAANVFSSTTVTLSVASGTGTLGGTLTGVISAGTNTATISGVTYSVAESGVSIHAAASGGDPLTAANSAPFTVDPPPTSYVVTSMADTGAGSLRNGIALANSGGCPACAITFNLAPPYTIAPNSALPAITQSGVTIDGTTQPGFAGSPIVLLDGSFVALGVNGLTISASNTTVRGLGITRFTNHGIAINSSTNTIGGTAAGAGNVITNNGGAGVAVLGSGIGNTILSNQIHNNLGIGIDLLGDSITANDAGDGDTGPNNLQNFPVINDAFLAGGTLNVVLSADSAAVAATHSLRIESFLSDPSGYQGKQLLSSQCIAGNNFSNQTLTMPSSGTVVGDLVVATATSYTDNACATPGDGTSEFSTSFTVRGCTPPAVSILPASPQICPLGSVTLTASAGTSYLWSPGGATTQSITVSPATTTAYTVTVTNASGCSGSASTTVTIASAITPTITPSGPTNLCPGGNVILTASAGTSYLWSPGGATTQSITVNYSSPGSYSVTVTNGTCTATSAPTIVTANTPTASITPSGPTTFCAGGSVTLTASAGSSYSWSTGANSQSITVTTAGTYSVTVTTGSCSASASQTVNVNTATTPVITPSGPTTFCAGGSVTLTSTAATSYLWSNGATTQSIAAAASGSYTVTATNASGCSATSAPTLITVNAAPAVSITGPSTVCPGGSVTLDAGPFTSVLWSTGATTNAITVTPATTTTYSVTVTNASGCTATASKMVTVSASGGSVSVTAPGSVAAGSLGNVASVPAGPPGTTYAWTISGGAITSGNGTPSITFTAPLSGPISIGVTVSGAGCTSTGSASVTVISVADLHVTMSGSPNPANAGDTITFTVNLSNAGPNAATGITVISTLTGAAFKSAAGSGWNCSGSGSPVNCSMATLPLGAAAPLSITAIAPAAAGSVTDDLVVIASSTDPNLGDDNANATVIVNGPQPSCNNTAPALSGPPDGTVNVPNPVTFTWSSANASSYDLWVASGNNAPAVIAHTTSNSATVTLPSGAISWYVAANFGQCPTLFSAVRTLTVAASTTCQHDQALLSAPLGGSVHSPVTFSWMPVAQAIGYRLWVNIDGAGAQDVATTSGAISVTVALSGGTVNWFVESLFGGCPSTLSDVASFSLAAPDPCANRGTATLSSPADNATSTGSLISFEWNGVPNANGYRLWASIGGGPFEALGVTTTESRLPAIIASGQVEWFVETLFNGCGSTESVHRTVNVPAAVVCNPSAAQNLSPASTTLNSGAVDFSWSAAPNAIGYEVWLALNGGTATLLGTTQTSAFHGNVPAGALEWFVRAQFNGCGAADSAHAQFTFAPPPQCTAQRPILVAPADNALLVSPVDFQWSAVAGAQYRVLASVNHLPAVQVGSTTTATHLDAQSLANGLIEWSVEATVGNCPSMQSTGGVFTVVAAPPPCADPEIPSLRADSTASSNVEYVVRWSSEPNAFYEIQQATRGDFSDAVGQTLSVTQAPFIHVNSGGSSVRYRYRVRAINKCTGARTLFSDPVTVDVLSSAVTDPNQVTGSTPADNPQPTHYQIHIGGTAGKGTIAAAAGTTFTATPNQPWLTVTPSSGVVPAEGLTLDVTADAAGLPVGTNTAAVTIALSTASSSSLGPGSPKGDPPPTTTTVSVNVVQPVSPTPKSAPGPDALIIPAVAHAAGVNSNFQSDVRLTNTSPQLMKYQLTFTPSGEDGIKDGKQATLSVDPGRTIALDDVLQTWFGEQSATGSMEIRPLTATTTSTSSKAVTGLSALATFAASRTFNATGNGTFGQFIPAVPFANFVGAAKDPSKSSVLTLQQVSQSSAFRTNLGLLEGSGEPATVLITAFAANGQKLTEFTQQLSGGQHLQMNGVLAQKSVAVDDGRIEVKVIGGTGKITAYASVLDNATSDPLLVSPMAINALGASKYVIPGVADLNNGFANWQTDVRVFNAGSAPVNATATFYGQSGETRSAPLSLAPNEVKSLNGVVQSLFGMTNAGGAMQITTASSSSLVASARTYNQTSNGTYGQFIPAVTPNDAAAFGTRALQLLQIEESNRYRTNIGVAEVSGKPAKVEITAIPSDSKLATTVTMDLGANQFVQIPFRSMGLDTTYNARVTVKVTGGNGRITAYASVIDMITNDPTFVPAQ